jgi:O-methyltransferase
VKIDVDVNLPTEVARRLEDERALLAAIASRAIAVDLSRRGLLDRGQLGLALGLDRAEIDALLDVGQVGASPPQSPFHPLWERTLRENAATPEFASRQELYDHLNWTLLDGGEAPIDFLEFGVFKGDSLRQWCALSTNPRSRFFGFDSFRGLPEYWKPGRPRGAFDRGGGTPAVDDPRVQWVVGWFQDSLPEFLQTYRPAGTLVVHNDSDLYSSTLFCLTSMHAILRPGTLIIFDEFDDILHEFRALTDYCNAYRRTYKIIAHTPWFTQTALLIH